MISDRKFKDLLNVGPHKPLGYLPLEMFHNKKQLKDILHQLILRNLTIIHVPENECFISSRAIFAWDYKALTKLLNKNKDVLSRWGWPITAEIFVRYLFINLAPAKTKLFNVVADAFNDKNNKLRKR